MMNLRLVVYSLMYSSLLLIQKPIGCETRSQTPCLMLNQNHHSQPMRCDCVVYVAPSDNQE